MQWPARPVSGVGGAESDSGANRRARNFHGKVSVEAWAKRNPLLANIVSTILVALLTGLIGQVVNLQGEPAETHSVNVRLEIPDDKELNRPGAGEGWRSGHLTA